MKIINQFIEKINAGENNFIITDKDKKLLFVTANIGNGKFVYSDYTYGETTRIDKLELVAIVTIGEIYLTSLYNFGLLRENELPENVVLFENAIQDFKNCAEMLLPAFYNSLPIVEMEKGYEDNIRRAAKDQLLRKKDKQSLHLSDNFFSDEEVKNILVGVADFENVVNGKFENSKESWIETKAHKTAIQNLVDNPETVKPYEQKIADALNGIDAKTVKVEFEMNGKTACGKVNPDTIIRMMVNDDYFTNYNFCTTVEGKKIIKTLGASTWRNDRDNVLTCEHITKITYGRKELYKKENNIKI